MKGNFHLEVFVEIGVLDHQVARHYGQREVHLSGEEKRGERAISAADTGYQLGSDEPV